MFQKGALLVISGPSGAGKSTLIKTILEHIPDVYFSISTTTRPKRPSEVDGKDYYFVSKEEFEKEIELGMFLEWANVHGNYYGTSLRPVKHAVEEGKLVLFDIDVQGFDSIKKSQFSSLVTSVFVTTPTMKELRSRLESRGTDDEATIQKRLQNALKEMEWMPQFDFILINEELEQSKEHILAIAKAARLRRDKEEIEAFIEQWRKTD
ncbi:MULTISPECIES: guanylate kinase [unclassified Nitratiruptor]|uniref:guanylate kinase n=1 Tax=unclassified Nitratiruptor TaxID=2624044 RepID=UPI001916C77F|nr:MULTISPECIES: guanylate kinase [unclassified Nitratiruptor]BCD60799.1 guanylate kinase [Nitratiruptor sp. YY08-10]BCD64731.1 guanylate kinase [Nitratiruptor sp. YY08-14]